MPGAVKNGDCTERRLRNLFVFNFANRREEDCPLFFSQLLRERVGTEAEATRTRRGFEVLESLKVLEPPGI